MLFTLVLIFASGVSSVKHGTAEQCAAWYSQDPVKEIACSEIVLTPDQKTHLAKIRRVCDELSATAKSRGFMLTSVKFKDAKGESSCSEWDNARPSRHRDAD